jgi:N-acyl-D-amino-acid deacylase
MVFDFIIAGGHMVNGEKDAVLERVDVGIKDGRIEAIGDLREATASRHLDARGKVVAPGFIDVHVHSEIALLGGEHSYAGLLQGVTTQLMSPDGFGWAPLERDDAAALWESLLFSVDRPMPAPDFPSAEAYLDLFSGNIPANLVPQVPHCAVRVGTVGWDNRGPTEDELRRMKAMVAEWMEAGAVALALGLDYQPSAFATTHELVELSKVAASYGGLYVAHIRYNRLGREGAWRETLEVGRAADIRVHTSHENVDDISEGMLSDDVDQSFESYLYPASCTHLSTVLPAWAQAGGARGLRDRLRDWAFRYELQAYLESFFQNSLARGERAIFAATPDDRYVRRSLPDAARDEGLSLGAFGLKVLEEEYPYALMVYHRGVSEKEWQETIKRTITHPSMMVASDGIYTGSHGHPRGYGCFSRVLRLVRELGAIGLAEAVHKMSGFPAERFGIPDRGFLKEGFAADVVVFDSETVADRATWDDPRAQPVGVEFVMVKGEVVVDGGSATGATPGEVIRRA